MPPEILADFSCSNTSNSFIFYIIAHILLGENVVLGHILLGKVLFETFEGKFLEPCRLFLDGEKADNREY
jgi:hypothetical protein